MQPASQPLSPAKPVRPRNNRIAILMIIGIVAVISSLLVRNSNWAKERRLKNLNLEDLALAIHDDPNDPTTYFYYGDALLKNQQGPQSEQAFVRCVKMDRTNERAG